MMRCEVRVSAAGPLCSVQDGGRLGWLRYGVPASGAMDRRALAVVNAALGNAPGAAGIEVSLGGVVLDCVSGEVGFAVAGGGFEVRLGGQVLAPWTMGVLRAGQRLAVRGGEWGSWAMLGFAGVLQAQDWLGSVSTHSLSGLGGGMLRAGQVLVVTGARVGRQGDLAVPRWARPVGPVRVVVGPQERYFDADVQAAFFGDGFALSAAYDRMGVRLAGPALPVNAALDMLSEPILRGSVQVAGDGVATVMLADHGTTGGYPKIATVIGADIDSFVQRRSGEAVRFVAVTPAEAVAAARVAAGEVAACLAEVARPGMGLAERLMAVNLISGVTDGL